MKESALFVCDQNSIMEFWLFRWMIGLGRKIIEFKEHINVVQLITKLGWLFQMVFHNDRTH